MPEKIVDELEVELKNGGGTILLRCTSRNTIEALKELGEDFTLEGHHRDTDDFFDVKLTDIVVP